ncbi:MAG: insulinase family protein [Bacteroidales bacterium]|nr:insulinase family protein [Bacteroidales bacterium]
MIKKLLLISALLFGFAFQASAQQMPPIPVDSAVRIGKLPNGLTYYIRHNETPKGQADFYIAQKVGSILEDDNQRGLAHFLEHMCFNGTENFPGNQVIDWLESVGVKFGRNLNAYTSIDETVYNISNVPVDRTSVQDSCLLILHDWADGLLLDPEEIDKERGVIHEEWRSRNVGQQRIMEDILPTMYPNNKYGQRLPIGTMEVVDNFPYQALRDYYEKWYRPDQQGIIVVGDIDVDYIEGKIKEYFSPIQMPENPAERVYIPVEDTPGTIYAIGKDAELEFPVEQLIIKQDPIPDEMKESMMYIMIDYMIDMINQMLNQRFQELALDPNCPFSQAGAGYGKFYVAKTKDGLNVVVLPKGDDYVEGMEAAYRELLRASRGGFTVGEYDRAKAEYLSRLEKQYNGRDKQQNITYVNQYKYNFLDHEPIPSIEDRYQIMNQIIPMIPVEAINQTLAEMVTPENRVMMVMAVDKEGMKVPTAEEFEAMFAKVDAEDIEPYKDEMKEEPLIPNLPAPGKVVGTQELPIWGATELTLSNGVKVIVKNTDFKKDEIRFMAVAKGGTSTIADERANELMFLSSMLEQHGLGDYTVTDLQKYLQGKQAYVGYDFGNYTRELKGSTTVKDLPTLMELIYASMTEYNITEEDFGALQNIVKGMLANQESTPDFAFSKRMMEVLFASPANQMLTTNIIDNVNREKAIELIRSQLTNAADFTFYFVGDVTVDQITPLAEQYLATLPADAATATKGWDYNLAREPKTGTDTTEWAQAMQTPQTTCVIFITATEPYTTKNDYVVSAIGQVMSNRLLKKIREEMGAVYSIGASSRLGYTSKNNATIQTYFPMKPEMKEQVLAEIDTILNNMCNEITAEELNPVKEYMVKNINAALDQNYNWIDAMTDEAISGVDSWHDALDAVNSITTEDVQNMLKDILSQGNRQTILMDPAE